MATHSKSQFTRQDAERFWGHVDFLGPSPDQEKYPLVIGRCWIWKRVKDRKGYGIFGLNGRNSIASRVAFILHNGDIRPRELCVLHHCDNPACVRPIHLFMGTRKDNMDDCLSKGRYPTGNLHYAKRAPEKILRGEGRWNSVLNPEKVLEIRKLRKDGLKWCEICEQMGLPESTVGGVLNGRTWSHVQ